MSAEFKERLGRALNGQVDAKLAGVLMRQIAVLDYDSARLTLDLILSKLRLDP